MRWCCVTSRCARALRTKDGEPVQRIVASARCLLSVEDLRGVEAARRADELESRRQAHGAQPFDLGEPPLLRAALWQLGDEEQVLQLVIHHIGSDGWSQGVLNRELGALYAAALDGRPAALPVLPLQYADYALWQRETLSGPALQTQLDYWRTQLADLSVLALPTDHARPAQPSYRGAVLRFEVDARLTSGLRALAREAGGTLYMVLLAAFKVLLARTSGQDDIAVGTPVAGRGQVELEGLIGFFVNTLVLRTQVSGESGFRDVLQRVKETALGAYDHAQMPFEKLVEALAPQRDPSRNPLFQVMFALQNAPTVRIGTAGHSVPAAATAKRRREVRPDLEIAEKRGCTFGGCSNMRPTCSTQRLSNAWRRTTAGCSKPSLPSRTGRWVSCRC
jgi:non-ribosomal peptide synthetase component F